MVLFNIGALLMLAIAIGVAVATPVLSGVLADAIRAGRIGTGTGVLACISYGFLYFILAGTVLGLGLVGNFPIGLVAFIIMYRLVDRKLGANGGKHAMGDGPDTGKDGADARAEEPEGGTEPKAGTETAMPDTAPAPGRSGDGDADATQGQDGPSGDDGRPDAENATKSGPDGHGSEPLTGDGRPEDGDGTGTDATRSE